MLNKEIEFLSGEKINRHAPEEFLSQEASRRLKKMFEEDLYMHHEHTSIRIQRL